MVLLFSRCCTEAAEHKVGHGLIRDLPGTSNYVLRLYALIANMIIILLLSTLHSRAEALVRF